MCIHDCGCTIVNEKLSLETSALYGGQCEGCRLAVKSSVFIWKCLKVHYSKNSLEMLSRQGRARGHHRGCGGG